MQGGFIRHCGRFIYNGSGGGGACVNILLILRCGSRSFLSVTGGAFYRRIVRLIHQCTGIGRIHGFFCRFLSGGAACCRICRSSIGSCRLRRRRCSRCLIYSLCSRCLFCYLTGSSIRGRVVTGCITSSGICGSIRRYPSCFPTVCSSIVNRAVSSIRISIACIDNAAPIRYRCTTTSCITDDSIAAIRVRFTHSFDIIYPRIRVGAIVTRSGIIASATIV